MHPCKNKKDTYISLEYGEIYASDNKREEKMLRRMKLLGKTHKGVDITPKHGFKANKFILVAPVPGIVSLAKTQRGYGKSVYIDSAADDAPAVHRLCHLDKIYVQKGQEVAKGDEIGEMGSTGSSTSKHLHFEVRKGYYTLDPADYLT